VAAAEAANAELYSLEDDLIEVASPDGTSGIYTTYAGNYNTQFWTYYPYMATGKLYFTTWYGSDKYCSASVISPNNILVTAAHCLYDTDANRWHDSWLFVPADRNYSRPFGSFSWLVARVLSSWMQAPDYNAGIRYDVGVIRLANNSAGRPVTYYTGWLGRSWNQGYVQNQTEIGYAGNITQVFSRVSHSESYYAAADILAYGSNMGGGASGSPIMRAFHPYRSGAYNFVNAVQSGSNDINRPTRNVAPRFSSNNIVILCNDEGC
jgi:V8-like Glu-specific endopeptidase